MKRIDYRIVIGSLLILAGLLGILDRLNIIKEGFDLFWAAVFALGGAAFLYLFFSKKAQWWTAIPGFTLLGMAASSFLPDSLSAWDGLAFLGGIGLSFFAIYFSNRKRWWAIIPGGVLITLGATSVLDEILQGVESTGGFLFIGIGLTFLLVAVLARMTWAFIPAVALIVLGILLGTPFQGALDYIWIAALFMGGILMIWNYFRK